MAKGLLAGQVCLITGGSSGIGKATATALANMGATVVIVCRDAARGSAAQSEISRTSGNSAVAVLLADLSSQNEVRKLAAEFMAKYERLDLLINNAATINPVRKLTADKLEATFATNYLAPFLLTNLLLPLLKASRPARIVNVAARTFRGIKLDFNNLQGEKNYRGTQAYLHSKLANVMFTYTLAARLEGSGVTVNAVHPGIVRTELDRNLPAAFGIVLRTAGRLFTLSPSQSAERVVYLATAPEVASVTGKYFAGKKAVKSSPESYDKRQLAQLWEISTRLAKLSPALE